jgi:hypothetical protein
MLLKRPLEGEIQAKASLIKHSAETKPMVSQPAARFVSNTKP